MSRSWLYEVTGERKDRGWWADRFSGKKNLATQVQRSLKQLYFI